MTRRGAFYLAAIIPLHYFAILAGSLPPAILLPPDLLIQAALAVPLFAALLYWAVPALLRKLGILSPDRPVGPVRAFSLGVAGLCIALAMLAIATGFATPTEATVLGLFFLLLAHWMLLRKLG